MGASRLNQGGLVGRKRGGRAAGRAEEAKEPPPWLGGEECVLRQGRRTPPRVCAQGGRGEGGRGGRTRPRQTDRTTVLDNNNNNNNNNINNINNNNNNNNNNKVIVSILVCVGWAHVMEKNLASPVMARRAGSTMSMGEEVSTRGSVKPGG